jgi:hypothetical protein
MGANGALASAPPAGPESARQKPIGMRARIAAFSGWGEAGGALETRSRSLVWPAGAAKSALVTRDQRDPV